MTPKNRAADILWAHGSPMWPTTTGGVAATCETDKISGRKSNYHCYRSLRPRPSCSFLPSSRPTLPTIAKRPAVRNSGRPSMARLSRTHVPNPAVALINRLRTATRPCIGVRMTGSRTKVQWPRASSPALTRARATAQPQTQSQRCSARNSAHFVRHHEICSRGASIGASLLGRFRAKTQGGCFRAGVARSGHVAWRLRERQSGRGRWTVAPC
jgi:hypothetical protein